MKLRKKTFLVLIVILVALILTAAIVSAAEVATANTIAAADVQGAVSGTIHRLISPWAIDTGHSMPAYII